jgi:hypothetical protein
MNNKLFLDVGFRDRIDLGCVGALDRFDKTKYFVRFFPVFLKNPPHFFH